MKKTGIIIIIVVSLLAGFFAGLLTPTLIVDGTSEEENLTAEEMGESDSLAECKPGSVDFYRQMVENLELVEIYDSSELTIDILQNRDGKIIIEECIGMVTNKMTGAGRVLNCADPDYYYISYSNVDDIRDGTIVLTYFIYNPDSNAEDDILYRFDYIIDREYED